MLSDRAPSLIPVRVSIAAHDEHPWLGVLVTIGLAAGALLAVFGLPPVDLHGPLHYLGIMDPLCGGTRGVHAALRGEFGQAWRYNPLSLPLLAGAVLVLARQAAGMLTGRWLTIHLTRPRTVLITAIALGLLLEINQQPTPTCCASQASGSRR